MMYNVHCTYVQYVLLTDQFDTHTAIYVLYDLLHLYFNLSLRFLESSYAETGIMYDTEIGEI